MVMLQIFQNFRMSREVDRSPTGVEQTSFWWHPLSSGLLSVHLSVGLHQSFWHDTIRASTDWGSLPNINSAVILTPHWPTSPPQSVKSISWSTSSRLFLAQFLNQHRDAVPDIWNSHLRGEQIVLKWSEVSQPIKDVSLTGALGTSLVSHVVCSRYTSPATLGYRLQGDQPRSWTVTWPEFQPGCLVTMNF